MYMYVISREVAASSPVALLGSICQLKNGSVNTSEPRSLVERRANIQAALTRYEAKCSLCCLGTTRPLGKEPQSFLRSGVGFRDGVPPR